ncbi:tape measure protein [Enterococcus dongliensis]|uniref:phage tail protein n=1 Tax=Enterococcus dongliensis TaxID=2559925 RepID=UPI00289055F5|nr:tape measure protein [Enterococcus dongliensis]MDT2676586.1 tape measure protein [Enterococcus dongliensis]
MESYSVEAILSAADKNFTSTMRNAENSISKLDTKYDGAFQDKNGRWRAANGRFLTMKEQSEMLGKSFDGTAGKSKRMRTSILDIAKGIGVFKVVQGGINLAKNAVVGLATELSASSATWKTFTGNMENLGKSKSEIASVKKELQDFATQTIYSASDMATTYSQLEAVGIKSSNKLVKGFGGLAAAAENPKQAMKTLSQQATQMAAKPTVQWMDFKLMLEQTPAGMAAVAKTMGMTTSELVKNVQDGTVKTQEFFDAVTKTGTNDTFGKMATEYKTVGQAVDGLKETLVTKLQPAFDKVSGVGIKAVEGIIGKLEKFNFDKFVSTISAGATKVIDYFKKIWESLKKGLEGFDTTGFKKIFDTVVSIAKVAFGVILAILPTVVEWIGKLATFFSKVVTAIQPFLPILLPIIGAWAAFMIQLKGISTVILMFKNLKTAISGIVTTFKILTAIMAANPFVLIVGAIVGLVAAFVYLWNTSENFRNFWINLWEAIKVLVNAAVSAIKSAWSAFSSWFTNIVSGAVTAVVNRWNNFKTSTVNAFNNTVQSGKNIWNNFKSWIIGLVSGVVNSVLNWWNNLKQNTINNFNLIVDGAKRAWNTLTDSVRNVVDTVKNVFDGLKNIDLFSAGKAIIDGFLKGIKEKFESVKSFVGGIAGWIKKHKGPISYDKRLLIPAGNAIMASLNTGLKAGFGAVKSNVSSMADRLSTSFDIGGRLAKMSSSIDGKVEHEVSYGSHKKPTVLNVNIGNQSFKAFVDDISQVQGQERDINLAF